MAPVNWSLWSNLPPDIVSLLAKILNTDVDTIRLRSVCSSWRSSVRPRLRPSSFPLRYSPFTKSITDVKVFLNYTTIYRLSPPKHGPHAGDPSDGWLFRVLEVSPNRFSVLAPLFPKLLEFVPGTIPKSLNLLDFRISEVCKCYCLRLYDGGKVCETCPFIKKVVVLWNYTVECEFAVVVLFPDGRLGCWKFGDLEWTPIDSRDYVVTDMAVCNGKFYAINSQGVLSTLDSNFSFTLVDFPQMPAVCVGNDNYLVEYKSDLYAFTKILKSPRDLEGGAGENPWRLEIFKKCSNWKCIECLGNDLFLSSDDYSFGVSTEDFKRLKGNCVYMVHTDSGYSRCYSDDRKLLYGVFDLDKGGNTSIKNFARGEALVYWPPPEWLMSLS